MRNMAKVVRFVTERTEKLIVHQVQKLKSDRKKFMEPVRELHSFLRALQKEVPKLPATFDDPAYDRDLRHRATRLANQAQGLYVVSEACLAMHDTAGVRQPWPSEVKAAQASLTNTPMTVVAQALETWAGARAFMSKIEGLAAKSTLDDTVIARVKNFCEKAGEMDLMSQDFEGFLQAHSLLQQHLIVMTEDVVKLVRLAMRRRSRSSSTSSSSGSTSVAGVMRCCGSGAPSLAGSRPRSSSTPPRRTSMSRPAQPDMINWRPLCGALAASLLRPCHLGRAPWARR